VIITGKVDYCFLRGIKGLPTLGKTGRQSWQMVLLIDADLRFLRAWNVRTAQGF
jgi:hypothetical protein